MKRLPHITIFFAVALLVAADEKAKVPSSTKPTKNLAKEGAKSKQVDRTTTIEISLIPADVPKPALKYQLLPTFLEQTPGNAAPIYMRAFLLLEQEAAPTNDSDDIFSKMYEWMELPPKKLPIKEVSRMLGKYKLVFEEVELASRRARCDWNLPIRETKDPWAIVLSELVRARLVGRMLALQARLQIAQRRYEEAIGTLRTGYSLARHLAQQPLLVSCLSSGSIANMMDDQLETLIQSPGSPNLYWAITTMPKPLIDIRTALQRDSATPYQAFPKFMESKRRKLTSKEWKSLFDKIVTKLDELESGIVVPSVPSKPIEPRWKKGLSTAEKLIIAYPSAKKALIARGRDRGIVEAMPKAQVAVLHIFRVFEQERDEVIKWFSVPYWQIDSASIEKAAKRRKAYRKTMPVVSQFLYLMLPMYVKGSDTVRGQEQHQLLLRCIEAIRIYAAKNEGKLPARLSDITEVPIPLNPRTGKTFDYQRQGNTAILLDKYHYRKYRLTIAKQEIVLHQSNTKAPVPDGASIKLAETKIQAVFPRTNPSELIKEASSGEGFKPAERYVLLQMARHKATEAGEPITALKAIQEIGNQFDNVDILQLKANTLRALKETARSKSAIRTVALVAMDVTKQAIKEGNASVAKSTAAIAMVVARKTGDNDLILKATLLTIQVAEKFRTTKTKTR